MAPDSDAGGVNSRSLESLIENAAIDKCNYEYPIRIPLADDCTLHEIHEYTICPPK